MAARDIIVIGTSTGGVETLAQVVRGLPPGFPASIFVVCHFPPGGRSILPDILSRSGPLLATHAIDGEPFHPAHIYVAPPDWHLHLAPGRRIVLGRGARENHFRPAVDPLFRSAAREYGPRVVGVILTGALYDGTAGLLAVRGAGGVAVVQDPRDALVAAMPQTAAEIAGADHVVPAARLAGLLIDLVNEPVAATEGGDRMDPIDRMPAVVDRDMDRQAKNERRGDVSTFTCPECGGALWQVDEPGLIRFRCHVGHAYSGEALFAEQTESLEAALWTAVRTFREKSVLGRQLAAIEQAKGNREAAARFEERAAQSAEYGALIQKFVLDGPGARPPAPARNGAV
jgi:two-component system, chemotaxis family, protein-glutamate methylesterase/glutaminase